MSGERSSVTAAVVSATLLLLRDDPALKHLVDTCERFGTVALTRVRPDLGAAATAR